MRAGCCQRNSCKIAPQLDMFVMFALLHHPASFLSHPLSNYPICQSEVTSVVAWKKYVCGSMTWWWGAGEGGQWQGRSQFLLTSFLESEGSHSSKQFIFHHCILIKKITNILFSNLEKDQKQTTIAIQRLKISPNMYLTTRTEWKITIWRGKDSYSETQRSNNLM